MSRQSVAKREKRPAVSRRQPAGIAVPSAFLSEIAAQDRARRLLRYEVIGKLMTVSTERGAIEFPRDTGPGIGVDNERDQLLFVSSWSALPELKDYSDDFCPACLEKCDICDGSGITLCVHVGCGGAGQVTSGLAGCGCGADASCEKCGGSGNVPILRQCPNCKGSGKAKCGPCRGTGKQPSGKGVDGQKCEACRGTLRGGKWQPQDLHSLLAGKIDRYIAIGPVLQISVKLPKSIGKSCDPIRAIEFSPSDGMMIVLPVDQGAHPPAYFWRQPGL